MAVNYGYIELAGIIQEISDHKILVQTVETSVRRRLHSNIYAARLLGLHNTIGLWWRAVVRQGLRAHYGN